MTSDPRDVEAHQGIRNSPPWVWDPDSRTDSWEQGERRSGQAATSLGHSEWQASASCTGTTCPQPGPAHPRPPQTRGFRELRGSGLRGGSWASIIK